ncbi:hypothetical protein GCM10010168_33100 [Actinoplanes ianthinogenes]|uniref:hypothetical protein n=1 Tax=Actinoplanes ianthinogenes TaxID=122358 RepID=UPI00166FBDA9|nr:hypothetical protein [Actinoplanes ianthinogenes]GGR12729.1 hypothetical protein GCM10010168_33100 [Actinoplanes ianthinogenes]
MLLTRRTGRDGGTPPSRHRLILIAAVLTGLGATAAPALPHRSRAGAPPPAAGLDELRRLPPIYEAMYHRGAQKRLIDAAQTRLIGRCMAAAGLTYDAGDPAPVEQDDVLLRPFGVESTADTPPDVPENPERTGAQAERYARVLYGDPAKRVTARGATLAVSASADGCQADAENALAGADRVRQMELRIRLYEAESAALTRFETESDVAALRREWQGCVREQGITAAGPAELFDSLPAGTDLATDHTVAVDLACKERTGYLRRAYTTMARLQNRELDSRPGLLADWNRIQEHQVAAAQAILHEPN